MSVPVGYLVPPLPEGLEGLAELALDLRWSWSHAADVVWARLDPELWDATRNPWLILQTVSQSRLWALARDADLRQLVGERVAEQRAALRGPAWFRSTHPEAPLEVAYFSMEFGLSEALPVYSGGLGILAGDHLKTLSDLGVPLVGVGLLYQRGYFRQAIDAVGNQLEFFPYSDPLQLPLTPVRDSDGSWLRVIVELPGRELRLRIWKAQVGRVRLYLLDSNDPVNNPADRAITSELYGGGPELRLQQEIVLGIGGWRLLRALGARPDVCHLNEGHAALVVLERARTFMLDGDRPFNVALTATRAGNIFTTHTPVEAGFDRFSPALVAQYLGGYADELGIGLEGLLALGRRNPGNSEEPLNMAYLAVRGSGAVNGVSRLHEEVSRGILQPLFPRWPRHEVPVTHVTNGVHMPSWDSAAADALWTETSGKGRWLGTLDSIREDFQQLPAEVLWSFRGQERMQLITEVRSRLARQLKTAGASVERVEAARSVLDPETLTIGFARRFAVYKRPDLLLRDAERLLRLLNHPERPVQLVVAGKAHPQDVPGKAMVRAWLDFVRRPEARSRAVFLSDYDMALAEQMVQGVDLWINTPRRPWEASGTSGMKVLVNGGINLSELDGWWAEAYGPEVGWALGDGREHGEDPAWDAWEAQELYRVLEEEVAPSFYERDEKGIPRAWVERVRASMGELTPRFSANRMLREYVERLYLPAAVAYRERTRDGGATSSAICEWREAVELNWNRLRFGNLEVREADGGLEFRVPVCLGGLEPSAVSVQLYAEPVGADPPDIIPMMRTEPVSGTARGHLYQARVDTSRPASDFTPRVVPAREYAHVPLESNQIRWYG